LRNEDETNEKFGDKTVFHHYIDENGFEIRGWQRLWCKVLVSYKKCKGLADHLYSRDENRMSLSTTQIAVYLCMFRYQINRVCRELLDIMGFKTKMKYRSYLCSVHKTLMVMGCSCREMFFGLKEYDHSSVWQVVASIGKDEAFSRIFNRDFKVESINQVQFCIDDGSSVEKAKKVVSIDEDGGYGLKTTFVEHQVKEIREKVRVEITSGGKTKFVNKMMKKQVLGETFIPNMVMKILRKARVTGSGVDLTFESLYRYYFENRASRNEVLTLLGKNTRRKANTLPIGKERLKSLLDNGGQNMHPTEIAVYKTFRDILENKFQFSSRLREFRWLYNKFEKEKEAVAAEKETINSISSVIFVKELPDTKTQEEKDNRRTIIKNWMDNRKIVARAKILHRRVNFLKTIDFDCVQSKRLEELRDQVNDSIDEIHNFKDPKLGDNVSKHKYFKDLMEDVELLIREIAHKHRYQSLHHPHKLLIDLYINQEGDYQYKTRSPPLECECISQKRERRMMAKEDKGIKAAQRRMYRAFKEESDRVVKSYSVGNSQKKGLYHYYVDSIEDYIAMLKERHEAFKVVEDKYKRDTEGKTEEECWAVDRDIPRIKYKLRLIGEKDEVGTFKYDRYEHGSIKDNLLDFEKLG
jgi:hypothetical protein